MSIDLKTKDPNSSYPPIIQGQTAFLTSNGMTEISGIIFSGSPGYDYNIIFRSSGIDISKQSNQDYMSSDDSTEINLNLTI